MKKIFPGDPMMTHHDPIIDNERPPVVMIPEDVALFLRKSVSWVYKHWRELSGVKIGGSIIFPDKETLHEHIFRRKEGVEVRLHQEGAAVHRPVVPNQKGRKSSRGKKEGGNPKPQSGTSTDRGGDINRHNLFGAG